MAPKLKQWRRGLLLLLVLSMSFLANSCVPAAAAPREPPGNPMRFAVVRNIGTECYPVCAEWISAEGTIKSNTANVFRKFLKRQVGNRRLPVVIESPGGDLKSAMALGKLIRAKGLDVAVGHTNFIGCSPRAKGCKPADGDRFIGSATSVNAYCASACPLVLAGGVKRVVGKLSILGVHQITTVLAREKVLYRKETRFVKGKRVTTKRVIKRTSAGTTKTTKLSRHLRRELTNYFVEMGVSAEILVPIEKTPSTSILRLEQPKLTSLKLVTETGKVEYWLNAEQCSRPKPLPSHCRKVPEPPKVQIVRLGKSKCRPSCPEWISLQGDIDKTALPLLQKALATRDTPLPVIVSSRGGDIESALKFGRFIREKRLIVAIGRTFVYSKCNYEGEPCGEGTAHPFRLGLIDKETERPNCTGVCALVLAGGVERVVRDADFVDLDSFALLGLSLGDKGRKSRSRAEAMVKDYLDEMGFEPEMAEMFPTSDEASLRLSGRSLREAKLATMSRLAIFQ